MKEIAFDEMARLAGGLSRARGEWHFHLLGPDCVFNAHKGQFSILLEDGQSREVFYSLFDRQPLRESRALADLMYGKGFLEPKETGGQNPDFEALLKRAQEMDCKGMEWHPHHLPPGCAISKRPDRHCLLVEDRERQTVRVAVYDQKPAGDLARIERLFYRGIE